MNFKGLNTKTKKLKDQSVKNPKDKKKKSSVQMNSAFSHSVQ
jgi:hypothetical protein